MERVDMIDVVVQVGNIQIFYKSVRCLPNSVIAFVLLSPSNLTSFILFSSTRCTCTRLLTSFSLQQRSRIDTHSLHKSSDKSQLFGPCIHQESWTRSLVTYYNTPYTISISLNPKAGDRAQGISSFSSPKITSNGLVLCCNHHDLNRQQRNQEIFIPPIFRIFV